jgi:hypothetical protein
MLRNTVFTGLIVLCTGGVASAAVTITVESQSTPGLPGFQSYTFTAVSDDPITAFDFVGDGRNDVSTGKGFFGSMNQVGLPVGPTIFEDFNVLIPIIGTPAGSQVSHDSQFKVVSTAVVVPPGLAEEGPNLLQAAWAWASPQGRNIPFAQVVVPGGELLNYRGTVTALVSGVQTDFNVSGVIGPIGEGFIVVVAANIGTRIRGSRINHQFHTASGALPIVWSNVVATTPTGSPPVNAPSLTSTGLLTWQSSALDARGTYHFDVMATNAAHSDIGRLTVVLIPEPATWLSFASCLGLLLGARRTRAVVPFGAPFRCVL